MKKNLVVAALTVAAVALAVVADRAGWLERVAPAGESTGVEIVDLKGGLVDLAPYKGKVVLLNYWATWCAPCQIEIPWFIDFQRRYGDRGLQIVGVSLDEEGLSAVQPWVNEQRFDVDGQQAMINYPILIGDQKASEQFFELFGMPTTLVISREGKVLKTFVGLSSHEKLVAAIESAL